MLNITCFHNVNLFHCFILLFRDFNYLYLILHIFLYNTYLIGIIITHTIQIDLLPSGTKMTVTNASLNFFQRLSTIIATWYRIYTGTVIASVVAVWSYGTLMFLIYLRLILYICNAVPVFVFLIFVSQLHPFTASKNLFYCHNNLPKIKISFIELLYSVFFLMELNYVLYSYNFSVKKFMNFLD